MSYQVLARKWRPQTFDQVVGQTHVLRALVNALDSDRLHHAYLFTGTRGVGKTSLARVFAKALNCEKGVSSNPCGECSACLEVEQGRFVDLIEVDAASRTRVDETRELLDNVQYAATRGRFKIYLIDEVHMFSTHSFNALLKTLEEPPPHVKFLLATTDPKKLPVTILSRCLQFNLKRVNAEQIGDHLAMIVDREGVDAEPAALKQLAQAADGSVRDALSLLDQAIAFGGGELRAADVANMLGTIGGHEVVALIDALANQDGATLIGLAREMANSAPDYHYVLGELLSTLRRVAVVQALAETADTLDESDEIIRLAQQTNAHDIQLFYQIGLIGRRDLSLAPEPQSGFEMVLLRMLAFRPFEENDKAAPKIGRTQITGSVANPSTGPSRDDAPAASRVNEARSESPVTERARAAMPAAPDRPQEIPSPAPDGEAAPGPEPGDQTLDWHATVAQLKLDGLVRELARNAAVAGFNGKIIELLVEPPHENLKVERVVRSLARALKEQLDLDVQIRLSVAEAGSLDTPAKRMTAEELERQRQAEETIAADPTVKTLQSEFGATIESVFPRQN